MRLVSRLAPTIVAAFLLAVPAAQAATPTATTAAAPVTAAPQTSSPGSAFGPLGSGIDTVPSTQTTVTATKRAGDSGSGRGTLLFLSLVALLMIGGVGAYIWYEGRNAATTKKQKRRHRMRSGRTPQAVGAGAEGRRGPPPPPRKRRAQAKRKKR